MYLKHSQLPCSVQSVMAMELKPEFTVETGSPTASTFEDGDTPRISDSGDSGSGGGTSQPESEGERAAKAKYLFRLGIAGRQAPQDAVPRDAVYQSREDRPKQHCTLIIFDWDDTLLCTSAIQSTRPPATKDLLALEAEAVKLLELAKTLGTVIIITNAIEGWWESSSFRIYPMLDVMLTMIVVMLEGRVSLIRRSTIVAFCIRKNVARVTPVFWHWDRNSAACCDVSK